MTKFFTISLFLFASLIANAQSKIAHLNSQDVMAAMPSYNRAFEKLEDFQKEIFAEMQAMKEDFDKNIAIYQEMVANGESPTLIQIQEQKLAKKEQAIREREQSAQQEVEAYSRELNYPIVTRVDKAVNIVADRNGYDYVLDVTMLMISNGPDITKEVIAEVIKLENAPPPQEDVNTEIPPQVEMREEEVVRP